MVTLSRVIASWLGTSRVTTRRSTFVMRSMKGIMKNKPGPLAPTKRPRRKMTPRSYSCTILMALLANASKIRAPTPHVVNKLRALSMAVPPLCEPYDDRLSVSIILDTDAQGNTAKTKQNGGNQPRFWENMEAKSLDKMRR